MSSSLLSRWNGEFTDFAAEQAFRRDTLAETQRHARLVVLVGAVFYALFALVDYYTLGWSDAFAVRASARLAVLLVGMAVWLRTRGNTDAVRMERNFRLFLVVLAMSFCAVTITRPPMLFTNVSMFVTLGAIYLAAPLSLASIVALCVPLSVIYGIIAIMLVHAPGDSPAALALLLVFANVFGAMLRAYTNRLRRLGYMALSNERRMHAELERSEERLRRLFMASPVPMALTRVADGRIVKVNDAAAVYLGVSAAELLASGTQRFYARLEDRAKLLALVQRDGRVTNFETCMRRDDGALRHVLLSATLVRDGDDDCLMVGVTDYTDRKTEEERLRHVATTDPLTGLTNRYHFFELAGTELARAKRHGGALAVLMIDIDHFKRINDSFGHAAGDAVLRAFAMLCLNGLRGHDTVARMGGEEFAVVLPESDAAAAFQIAERLRVSTQGQRVPFGDLAISYTVSIGLTAVRIGEDTLDAALTRADGALYRAKALGRNRVESAESQATPGEHTDLTSV